MASYAQIRSGLRDRLLTIAGLNTYLEWPSQVNPPAALINLAGGQYERAFGALGDDDSDVEVEIHLALGLAGGLENAQRQIEEYLDDEGTNSIRAAIVADRTLGNVVGYTHVRGWRAYDTVEINQLEYMGAIVEVDVANR